MNKFITMCACIALANTAFAAGGAKHPAKPSSKAATHRTSGKTFVAKPPIAKPTVAKPAGLLTGDLIVYGRPATITAKGVGCGLLSLVCTVIKESTIHARVNVTVEDEAHTQFSAYETYNVEETEEGTELTFEQIDKYVP